MDYGEVLSKAWKIIWNHKILWIFGILAGCGANSGGGGARGTSSFNVNSNQIDQIFPNLSQLDQPYRMFLQRMGEIIEQIPAWVWVLVVLLILLLGILTLVLSTIGRVGLIHGAAQADRSEAKISFTELFNQSLPYFWRIFFFNLLAGFVLLILLLICLIPILLVGVATLGIGLLMLLPFICLLIPITWLINVILYQSNIAIVIEDRGIFSGLARGWEIFTKNFGPLIVIALILGVGSSLVLFVMNLPLLLVTFPLLAVLISGREAAILSTLLLSGVLIGLFGLVSIFLNGVVQSYVTTTWTLTYRRLTVQPIELESIPPAAPEDAADVPG